jgi:hypothetical protein
MGSVGALWEFSPEVRLTVAGLETLSTIVATGDHAGTSLSPEWRQATFRAG